MKTIFLKFIFTICISYRHFCIVLFVKCIYNMWCPFIGCTFFLYDLHFLTSTTVLHDNETNKRTHVAQRHRLVEDISIFWWTKTYLSSSS
jgi:hypothetical protein